MTKPSYNNLYKPNHFGYIYILYHPSYGNDIFKISRTNNLNRRSKEHSTAFLEAPQIIYSFVTLNTKMTERLIHQKLYKNRIKSNSGGKEFFNIDINCAIETINQVIDSVNNPIIVDTLNDILIMS
jgi:hypothetical protein